MPLPLEGITVVSLEQAVAAPFATRQLGDIGARVIKIERPDGGDFARGYDAAVNGLSSYFCWLNRSKESLTLDLKTPGGAEVLNRLLARADVFVQNLAPGAAGRLGTEGASLSSRYPRLIVCNISGYGSTGPYASKKAYDLLVQSEVGLVSITGTEDTPSKVGISVADIAAGMYAYSGILTALFARQRHGSGTVIEVSLFDALAEWMTAPAYYAGYGGSPPPRTGAHHASIAPYGPFAASDGRQIFLAIQNAREWRRFCADILGDAALADDGRFRTNALRVQHRPALHAIVGAAIGARPSAAIEERLESAGIAWADMNTVDRFLEHPQLTARDCWREVASEKGAVRALVPPARIDGVQPAMGAIPSLGQHSEAILTELGFTSDTIAGWRREGTI